MSSNNPESQGQDWPIYPGAPGPNRSSEPNPFPEPVEGRRSSDPVEERYADPPPRDDAYRAYQSYVHQPPTDPRHLTPHAQPPRRPSSSSALQKKYVWIAIGIVAALVITSIARGGFNLWPVIIFAGIAWWIMNNRRKC